LPVTRGRRRKANSRYAPQAARLAGQLRELREDAGITQERLAAQAGVSIATVRKIETGAVMEPGYFTVMALMSVFGMGPEYLSARLGKSAEIPAGPADPLPGGQVQR
jgi:transcriptional regulator with XRE-family HTH domain